MAPQKVKAPKEDMSEVILFPFGILLECHYDSAYTKFQSEDQSLNKTLKNKTKPTKNVTFVQTQPSVQDSTPNEFFGSPKTYIAPKV